MADPKDAKEITAFCRSEAARLRKLAESTEFAQARAELLDIAKQYELLACQYESPGDGTKM